MNNYWFLYNLSDGSIYGCSYLGMASEWTNIPAGCGVIGPFAETEAPETVKEAFVNPLAYKVADGELVASGYVPPVIVQPPSEGDRLSAVEAAITDMMEVLASV